MWRDNCIEVVANEGTINSLARCVAGVRSRRNVLGIVRIPGGLYRQLKDLLTVIDQLLLTMRKIERDQIGQVPHVRVGERYQVVVDLRLELIQQRSELIIGIGEHVACICVNDGRTKAFHHVERMISE